MKRILITGPVNALARYAAAAEGAGWQAVELPMLTIADLPLDLSAESDPRPDWICITSSSAVRALTELPEAWRDVPVAVVGPQTMELVQAHDFQVGLGPADSAKQLATELRLRNAERGRVLWLRGNLATELGEDLTTAGFEVHAPVVYETTANPDVTEIPAAEVAFLASPSGVYRFAELSGDRPVVGIAIGSTTSGAMDEVGAGTDLFTRTLCLSEPSPAALRSALESLKLDETE